MRHDPPPAPASPAAEAAALDPLTALLAQLCALAAELPEEPLSDAERRRLGGHLLPHGPALVRAVAAGLQRRPELFADVPVSGGDLAERQRQAYRWLALRDALRALAERAADRHIAVQGQAVKDALAVVRATTEGPAPAALSREERTERRGVLAGAYYLCSRYQRRLEADKQRGLERARQRRRAAAEAERQEPGDRAGGAQGARGLERAWVGEAPGGRGLDRAWVGGAPGARGLDRAWVGEAPGDGVVRGARDPRVNSRPCPGRSAMSSRRAAAAAFDQATARFLSAAAAAAPAPPARIVQPTHGEAPAPGRADPPHRVV